METKFECSICPNEKGTCDAWVLCHMQGLVKRVPAVVEPVSLANADMMDDMLDNAQ